MADDYGPEPKWSSLNKRYGPPYDPKPYGCTGCFRSFGILADYEAHICDGKARKAELDKIRTHVKPEPSVPDVKTALNQIVDHVHELQLKNVKLEVDLAAKDTKIEKLEEELRYWIFLKTGDPDTKRPDGTLH